MPNLRNPQIFDSTLPIISGATAETCGVLRTLRNTNRSILLMALKTAAAQSEPDNVAALAGGKPWAVAYDCQEGFSILRPWILAGHEDGAVIGLHDHMPNPVTWSGWAAYDQNLGSHPGTNGVGDLSQGDAVFTAILPGGAQRARWLAYLDTLCAFFNSLVDSSGKKIPVIFRPLHEQLGYWFWWHGYSSKSRLVALWQDYVDRLRVNGVTNVLMLWCVTVNSVGGTIFTYSDFQPLYPGDTYVDIVGVDIYDNTVGGSLRPGWVRSGWNACVQLAGERNKPLTVPEMGFQVSATAYSATNEDFWTDIVLPYIKSNLYQARSLMFWSPPFGPTTTSSQNHAGAKKMMSDAVWFKR